MNTILQFLIVIFATGAVFSLLGVIIEHKERKLKRNRRLRPTCDQRNWQDHYRAWWAS